VGPQSGFGQLTAAFAPSGRAVLAWGTQDGGEEANQPWVVRAVTASAALRRWTRPQTLDPGQAADRPVGRLAAAALPDGTFGVAWSAVTASAGHLVHPVLVALGWRDGRFAAASTIAPSGAVGSVAGASDGRLLVTWSTTPDYANPSPVPATQAMSALRAEGAGPFGAPEPLAAPDVASPPLATFLPDGRAIAIWAARPDGHDPRSASVRRASCASPSVPPADQVPAGPALAGLLLSPTPKPKLLGGHQEADARAVARVASSA
jgi:hypothetical protein